MRLGCRNGRRPAGVNSAIVSSVAFSSRAARSSCRAIEKALKKERLKWVDHNGLLRWWNCWS